MISFNHQHNAAAPSPLPAPSPEATTVSRMAQSMIEMSSHGRIVDRDALIQAGFTRAEISAYSEAAADIAIATGRAD